MRLNGVEENIEGDANCYHPPVIGLKPINLETCGTYYDLIIIIVLYCFKEQ